MTRVSIRDLRLRQVSLPGGAARLALLIVGGLALTAPAIAIGRSAGPSVTMAGSSIVRSAHPARPAAGPVLYDQYDNATAIFPSDITSQQFEDVPPVNTATAEAADDFVVPTGSIWTVDAIDVDGEYQSRDGQTPSPVGFNVRFWANNPATTLPANMLAERLSASYVNSGDPGDVQVVVNPPVTLPAGTYWVSVQARLDFGSSTEARQWYWHNREVTSNAGAAWRNPGDYHHSGCIYFSRRATCQNSTHAPDQVFRLHGTGTSTGPPPPPPPPPAPPPNRCHVPHVVGRTLANARSMITSAHCRVGVIQSVATPRRLRGRVLAQSPRAGRNLPRNSRVHLLVGR